MMIDGVGKCISEMHSLNAYAFSEHALFCHIKTVKKSSCFLSIVIHCMYICREKIKLRDLMFTVHTPPLHFISRRAEYNNVQVYSKQ